MQVSLTQESVVDIEADAVVVGVSSADLGGDAILGPAADVDQATGGAISRLFEHKEITGKANEVTSLKAPSGVKALQVVVAGTGAPSEDSRKSAFQAAATVAKSLAGKPRQRVAYYLGHDWSADQIEAGVCGALVGCQGQDLYRAERKTNSPEELLWHNSDEAALRAGQILAESVNLTRRLVNEPPSDMNPEAFADTAAVIANQCGLECEVWNGARLEQENCGSLLAVARGSACDARLVILTHKGASDDSKTLALVGKGVTFDSGGLSLKPTDSMKTMKCDMAGAGTVVGAMQAIARMNLPVNVMGLVGLVENMVSGDSYKLGDVLTARNGKTIEVLNTDAEGRLVLADVLCVAVDRGAEKIIDLATLTGACVVALGTDVAGLMTNNQAWCDTVAAAAETCGEAAWQLPMFPEFGEQIKSEVADIKNVGKGRWGGAITAAKFLEEFVDGRPWVHIDIAGPSFLEDSKPWLDGGGSGAFVRTLVEVAKGWGRIR